MEEKKSQELFKTSITWEDVVNTLSVYEREAYHNFTDEEQEEFIKLFGSHIKTSLEEGLGDMCRDYLIESVNFSGLKGEIMNVQLYNLLVESTIER